LHSVLNVQCHQTKGLPLANCSQLGPALELSTLRCSSTHHKALQVLQIILGPAPPKASPDQTNK